nr:uncharacterized protein LOC119178475 isoform X2 [Rhipicephalus microplus]
MLVASVPLSRGSIRRNSPHAIQITKREGEMGQQKERCMLQCSLKMYQWYRCKIMQKIDDGKSHVQYLDYVATLRKQHISQAWCALLRSLPSSLWSFFCGFHGLQSLKRDNHRAFYDKVMFCCFYGWESLKKDDDPALYDKNLKLAAPDRSFASSKCSKLENFAAEKCTKVKISLLQKLLQIRRPQWHH